MYVSLQILLLFIFSTAIISQFERKSLTISLSILLSLFITLQVASLLMGGSLIDYKFYEHITIDNIRAVYGYFTTTILLVCLFFLLCLFLLNFFSKIIRNKRLSLKVILITVVFTTVGMSINDGAFYNIYELIKLKNTTERSFEQALEELGIDPGTYIKPEDLSAQKGKNIIVITIESFEKGFLSDSLAHLTPNLRKLAKEFTLYDMTQGPGSDWTSGSIYTEMTGVPCFFKGNSNRIFQGAEQNKLTGVGNVLSKAGYDLTYLLAGKEFAGVGDLLSTYQFNVKSEKDFPTNYPLNYWGLHDKDLFSEIKNELTAKHQSDKPFALFVSTISTHSPEGIYDQRMEAHVKKQASDLEFMAASVDYMIGDLMAFLKEKDILKNTVFYIVPDHQLMGVSSKVEVIGKFPKERGLYLITNAQTSDLSYPVADAINQIDLPKIILEGAKVNHNAVFLTDYIKGQNKLDFIKKHSGSILALNESALKVDKSFLTGINIELSQNKLLLIKSKEHTDTITSEFDANTTYLITFDERLRINSKSKATKEQIENDVINYPNLHLIIYPYQGRLYTTLRQGAFASKLKSHETNIRFSEGGIRDILQMQAATNTVQTDYKYSTPYPSIRLLSCGTLINGDLCSSKIILNDTTINLTRGFSLLTFEKGQPVVNTFDLLGDGTMFQPFIDRIKSLRKRGEFFVLVSHEAYGWVFNDRWHLMDAVGLSELKSIGVHQAYIAYHKNGKLVEIKDDKATRILLPY